MQGESTFSKDILSELITDTEKNCNELAKLREKIETELEQSEDLQTELCRSYDEIISWADLYDSASIEAKKMIVNSMIKRIDVSRDYKLKTLLRACPEKATAWTMALWKISSAG